MIKSGTDFREFSLITVNFDEYNNYTMDIKRIEVNSFVSEDPDVKATVDKYLGMNYQRCFVVVSDDFFF